MNIIMKRILPIYLFFFLVSNQLVSQTYSSDNPDYIKYVKMGEQALLNEKYDSCIQYYKVAFEIKQSSFLSTMRAAACGYSLNDKAYFENQLAIAMDLNWDGSKNIFYGYPEFEYLHGTPFEEAVNAAWEKAAEASGVNIELMQEMAEIRVSDQAQRQEMRGVEEKYGWDSPQMDSLWKIQLYSDSVNTQRIEEIIAEYGYPGKSLVGPGQAATAFLVIQHADLEVQEKYLPIITAAADADEVSWRSVALLVDRVNMRNGKPQIYGSQVGRDELSGQHYFFEIQNPEKIDSIRNTVGLGPIQEYGNNWNITWDVAEHKKINAEIKARKKEQDGQ